VLRQRVGYVSGSVAGAGTVLAGLSRKGDHGWKRVGLVLAGGHQPSSPVIPKPRLLVVGRRAQDPPELLRRFTLQRERRDEEGGHTTGW